MSRTIVDPARRCIVRHVGPRPSSGGAGRLYFVLRGRREGSYCADLKITPDGRFLYGTNRGHDSIAAYRIADDGRLSLLAITPSLGKGPQNLLITTRGELLLCANMPGNNVAVFRIDP